MKKNWVTEDRYFRLITTIFGIGIVDLWCSYDHQLPSKHCHKNCDLMEIVNMLAKDLLENEECDEIVSKDEKALVIGVDLNVLGDEQQPSNPSTASEITATSSALNSSLVGTTKETRIELELAKHVFKYNDAKLDCMRAENNPRLQETRQVVQKRTKRNSYRDCPGPKRARTAFYCDVYPSPSGCSWHWVCCDCHEGHCVKIRQDLENTHD